MSPATYDLTIYCGTTVDAATMTFTYKVSNEVVDLTGYTARSLARGKHGVLFDLDSETGGITLGGAAGTVAINLSAAQTSAMWVDDLLAQKHPQGQEVYVAGKWDLKLTSPSGRAVRLMQGRVLLSPEITP